MPQKEDRSAIVILVVDGEVVARNLTASRLHREGYTVLAAAHGKEALELLRTYDGTVDLLIADMDLAKIDGQTLWEAAAAERPGIRSCAVSADESAGARAAESRVPFLLKPLDPELLRRQFADILS